MSSRSSLSHAIAALERNLEPGSFPSDDDRSVAPTDAGERLLRRLTPVLQDLDQAIDAVADDGGHPSGTLRINGGEEAMRRSCSQAGCAFLFKSLSACSRSTCWSLMAAWSTSWSRGSTPASGLPKQCHRDMMAGFRWARIFRFLAVAAPTYLAKADQLLTPDDLRHHQVHSTASAERQAFTGGSSRDVGRRLRSTSWRQ